MIVMEYDTKFIELNLFGRHLVDTKHRKVDQFKDGLDLGIPLALSSQVFSKYQEIHQRAMRVENFLIESKIKNITTKRSGGVYSTFGE